MHVCLNIIWNKCIMCKFVNVKLSLIIVLGSYTTIGTILPKCCAVENTPKVTRNLSTPLLAAIGNREEELACKLIDSGANVNQEDTWGKSPICYASHLGLIRVVSKLIDKGANVDRRTFKTGFTPLHEAAERGHEEIITLLLNAGANPNARCNDEYEDAELGDSTPLDLAIKHKHLKVIELLQQATK